MRKGINIEHTSLTKVERTHKLDRSREKWEFFVKKIGSFPRLLVVNMEQRILRSRLKLRGSLVGDYWKENDIDKGMVLRDCV
jgi:hypothetical protein